LFVISVLTVPIERVKAGAYRDTFHFDASLDIPLEVDHMCFLMAEQVKAGATLPIHVAKIGEDFVIVDGHVRWDLYLHLKAKQVTVILHDDITTLEQAREAYVSMNYLAQREWLRSGVKLGHTLSDIESESGEGAAAKLVSDPEMARHLIRRNNARWWEFSSGEDGKQLIRTPKTASFGPSFPELGSSDRLTQPLMLDLDEE
jgi:hypothetical protein